MNKSLLLIFLGALVTLSYGFIDPRTYYFTTYMNPTFAYLLAPGQQDNNQGIGVFYYNAELQKLYYYIGFTNSLFSEADIVGPIVCFNPVTNSYMSLSNPSCISNTGYTIFKLATGSTTPSGTPKQTVLEGTLSFSNKEEEMLFAGELWVSVSSNGNTVLRGQIVHYNAGQLNSFLVFGASDGTYGSYPKSKTSDSAMGWVISNQNGFQYFIVHNIQGAGNCILQCNGGRSYQISSNPTSPVAGTFNFASNPSMGLSMFNNEGCFIFFTSSSNPNGDLFARTNPIGAFHADLLGANVVPAVSSGGYAKALMDFDRGNKYLVIGFQTNLTAANVISIVVGAGAPGTPGFTLCTVYTNSSGAPATSLPFSYGCFINETYFGDLQSGYIFIQVNTIQYPGGELRGQVFSTDGFSASLPKLQVGLTEGAKIGLGVGLGIGLSILIVGGVGIFLFFFYKRNSI